jgi:hypothetical protein
LASSTTALATIWSRTPMDHDLPGKGRQQSLDYDDHHTTMMIVIICCGPRPGPATEHPQGASHAHD